MSGDQSVATSWLLAYRFVPADLHYEVQRSATDSYLSDRITKLTLERRRFGYRRIGS